jgi:hypothetical protein
MEKDFDNVPLSQSSVSLRLADIQQRCTRLLDEPGEFTGLSLEEPKVEPETNNHNPYDRG